MNLLFDNNGFYKSELFLFLSIFFLYIVYKKGLKFILLPLIPLLLMTLYQNHIETELIARSQSGFIISKFNEVYQLDSVKTQKIDSMDDKFDTWKTSTDNGSYFVRFNKDKNKGFEIYQEEDESESLHARMNILELTDSLGIEGYLIYKDNNNYEIDTTKNVIKVSINEYNRVDEIVDESNRTLYINEEENEPEDGHSLEEEDFH